MAETRDALRKMEKEAELEEERNHLFKLSELQDRQMREDERRKDYRRQIDDYHRVYGRGVEGQTSMERAKSKECDIKTEAKLVVTEQDEANRLLREKFAGYGQE